MYKTILKLLIIPLLFTISCSSLFSDKLQGDDFIAVLTDIHISSDESKDNRLKEFVKMINSRKINAEMIVATGDCVSSVYLDRNQDRNNLQNNRLGRFVKIMSESQVPYYLVMGNHEHKIDKKKDSDDPFTKAEIDTAEKVWRNTTGLEPFYSKVFKDWKLIFMNSMRGIYMDRRFDEEQISWLKNELETDKSIIMFFHHPIETDNFKIWCKFKDLAEPEEDPQFFDLLIKFKTQIKGIFVGHGHMWVSDKLFDQIEVFETDSFGDSEGYTYSIIGLDHSNKSISVKKYE